MNDPLNLLPQGGILGAAVAAVAAVLALRRRWSSDSKVIATDQKAIATDKAETSYIAGLQARVETLQGQLDAVQQERNRLVEEAGALRMATAFARRDEVRKDNRIKALERKLQIYIDTMPGELTQPADLTTLAPLADTPKRRKDELP